LGTSGHQSIEPLRFAKNFVYLPLTAGPSGGAGAYNPKVTADPPAFEEATTLARRPIRDLGLTIAGTRLEPILAAFEKELAARGLTRVKPRFYLSTEWGVPDGTVAIAVPFYLARPELVRLHQERTGHVEGTSAADILRYLRHEMGHVVNYAYKLYERGEWVERFGAITQPYVEEYQPRPFSRRFVRHLPGWYAQKHPDEDWAETFAVWMTPGLDWRAAYDGWPDALVKLETCARLIEEVRGREPLVTDDELDEEVGEIALSLDELYAAGATVDALPPGVDGALRSIFDEDVGEGDGVAPRPARPLLERLAPELAPAVYRWTGHFPERTHELVRLMARRAGELGLTYGAAHETTVTVAVTTLVTALAMNHVLGGSYVSP
jgi:hypothetical protein